MEALPPNLRQRVIQPFGNPVKIIPIPEGIGIILAERHRLNTLLQKSGKQNLPKLTTLLKI